MSCRTAESRYVSESTWFKLNDVNLTTLMSIVLAATTVSLFLTASGMHELAVTPIVTVAGLIILGYTLSRLFGYFQTDGLPVIE